MSRFSSEAAATLRAAIAEAGGVEVLAIGTVKEGSVVEVAVQCRGTLQMVPALLTRPKPGQVVIHNHPSGLLDPSQPDLYIAGRYGEDGIGSIIVDNEVTRSNWIVEPHAPKSVSVSDADLTDFFERGLPAAMPGFEPRPAQLQMAMAVRDALVHGSPLRVEAGTGTGKSLAYLVPAALWARQAEERVVIATHTRALQGQLLRSDLPLLTRGGIEVSYAVMEGRSNYLCKRLLGLAREEPEPLDPEAHQTFQDLLDWSERTPTGSTAELGFRVPGNLWERVASDTDLSLKNRCEHFDSCHYYTARRRAASSSLLIVNHALLLADLSMKADGAPGVLPAYARLIVDEAHHLEAVATGAATRRVSWWALRRAIAPLLPRGRADKQRPGAIERLAHSARTANIDAAAQAAVAEACAAAGPDARRLLDEVEVVLPLLADALDPKDPVRRITAHLDEDPWWTQEVRPPVARLASRIEGVADALTAIDDALPDEVPGPVQQPRLDLRRAARRLSDQAAAARAFLDGIDDETCRWIEPRTIRGHGVVAEPCAAPIEVAPVLRRVLWDALSGVVATSATLTVDGDFGFFARRVGMPEASELILPSPFVHAEQAMIGLPTDLPDPNHPQFLDVSARVIFDAVRASGGGAFVLCTSFAAIRAYARHLRRYLPSEVVVLEQEAGVSRSVLLDRFQRHKHAVLVGADSFWEGVSVQGFGLRLVVIPRLPFRVPTDPLRVARQDRLKARGMSPFRVDTLPEAVLRLRQGYGRLIRARTDHGVVLILDDRVRTKSYGRVVLSSLPGARRVQGPWSQVCAALRGFLVSAYSADQLDPV